MAVDGLYVSGYFTDDDKYMISEDAKMIPGAKEVLDDINQKLQMSKDDFESRWTAD